MLQIRKVLSSSFVVEALASLDIFKFLTISREILAEIPIAAPALSERGLSERYPPPPPLERFSSPGADGWAETEEDSWYFFLSEIALRRITEEVAETIVNHINTASTTTSSTAIEELIPIALEFERQAYSWREHLPSRVGFPDVPEFAETECKQYSRGRYYRVLELIYRPFVFTALHKPGCGQVVRDLASKGLRYALNYLQHCHLTHRHHGRWLQLRNELREVCLLLVASRSGIDMPSGWLTAVENTLKSLDYWKLEYPAYKSYTDVIMALVDHFGARQLAEPQAARGYRVETEPSVDNML
jgi:hypothetical protein